MMEEPTMVRCGNCKGEHDTVAEVRACYGMDKPEPSVKWPPSDKQVSYLLGLQSERLLPPSYGEPLSEEQVRAMEKDEVSAQIGLLTKFPRKAGAKQGGGLTKYAMPVGRYALEFDGVWKFYEVNKPTEGRWAGYTFITMLIGAPGHYKKVRLAAEIRAALLERIERDPKTAMEDYGKQSGVCGRCSSPLTDPQSLALGIGPVCRSKTGWY